MRSFNYVGQTSVVQGRVTRTWLEDDIEDAGFAELTMETRTSGGTTVGPGTVIVTLPRSFRVNRPTEHVVEELIDQNVLEVPVDTAS
jgi:hypothetical protein